MVAQEETPVMQAKAHSRNVHDIAGGTREQAVHTTRIAYSATSLVAKHFPKWYCWLPDNRRPIVTPKNVDRRF